MAKIYLGLPAYNEEASIEPLFQRIQKYQDVTQTRLTIVVYDDGCRDRTKENVLTWNDRLEIIYLDGIVNKGLGEGMNSLLSEFVRRGQSEDLMVVMDCDDTHDPSQITEMLATLKRHPNTDVVIASRYRRGATISGVPFHRVLLSIGAACLYKMVHPAFHVRDYTCGYRAYTHGIAVKTLNAYPEPLLKERGFACMVELLLKCKHAGARFREIPLRLAYDNKLSASKMDVSGNTLRLLKRLISWRVRGLQ
ncbi:Glycosyl transferase family 2 [Rhizobium tibeticum]|uniref:Glycosyl transferase family 2 n=1 Tax=Rhizobium tibeticum TaxID=501024 RepID=A0A1H8NTT4_9HYPH|nr:glycosyltransferase [Rhizobium tibeticum]SEI00398.1 undecaprenyl phosphate 4-deoxy-4-formamido-L-arabinose transferase [Rhizobium tibeticum]SEO33001.1 Glycosyl transferase family 2 [Rhizobium tibeticum]